MKYRVLDRYTRRGLKIGVTIELYEFGTLRNKDNIEYDKTYAWGTLIFDGSKFKLLEDTVFSHESYPLPEPLDLKKIEELVNKSNVAKKVLKLIKNPN